MRAWFAAWVEAEQGRFLLLLPVAMGAAILAYFALPREPPLWLGLWPPPARWPPWWRCGGFPGPAGGGLGAGGRTRFWPGGVAHRG